MEFNKIWCIGAHRTGTMSISRALQQLNYKVIHYFHSHNFITSLLEANADLNKFAKTEIVNHYDAFSDNITPAIYQLCDKAFPKSKFILTLRDSKSWIESIERHLDGRKLFSLPEYMFYGFWYYNKQRCIDRYERHTEEIKKYFIDRHGDILYINIDDNKNNWFKLCKFFDKPVILEEFPHLNKGSNYDRL